MKDFRYMAIVAVAAAGLALAGCSSSSGVSTSERDAAVEAEQAKTKALQDRIDALYAALGIDEDADPNATIADLQAKANELEQMVADKEMADAEADRKAMAATAAKLYAGIRAQMGDGNLTNPQANDRDAAYGGINNNQILVSIGAVDNDGTAIAGSPVTLSEDKKTAVADNHGWEGKRYTDAPGGASVEAIVYSNVEAPKMGKKFGGAAANDEFEYLLTNGALTNSQLVEAEAAARIVLTGVTRTAGVETFKLPVPNPDGVSIINVPGSYHGVSGTYNCTPDSSACTATVADKGFTLAGGGIWTFTPSDANARVTEMEDPAYASYGWWLRMAANDGDWTASAFHDEKGGVAAATGLDGLNGTATYQGGAAGKYALASSTGGTNDAGHFTARATLEANFTANETATAITGTIDDFISADGEERHWSVKLNGSQIGDTGILNTTGDTGGAGAQTVWTIDGTAAAASGEWSGSLRNNGDDLVPQVATGTFYTEYGTAGRMVGAFGANKQ